MEVNVYTNQARHNNLANSVASNHVVQVCQNEALQAETVTQYIKEGLLKDEAVIVIARPALRKAVIAKMYALDLDVQAFKSQGQIKFLDAEFLLSGFWIDGELDEQSFHQLVGIPIKTLKLQYGKVRAMGEMVDILWKQGQHDTAMQLESLWNNLFQQQEFSRLCTYLLDSLDPNTYDESLERICQCHTHHFISVENYDSLQPATSDAVRDLFGAAWNRVVDKFADSQKVSVQIPSA